MSDGIARAGHLGQHVGREIQVNGAWLRIARCNGVGRHPYVNVWVDGQREPLELCYDETVPVRDPQPQTFTVVGVTWAWVAGQSHTVVAVSPGSPAVVLAEDDKYAPYATEVTTTTAVRAMASIDPPGFALARTEGESGVWAVVGIVDCGSLLGGIDWVAAINSDLIEGVYDHMGEARHVTRVVADTGAEALRLAEVAWWRAQAEED